MKNCFSIFSTLILAGALSASAALAADTAAPAPSPSSSSSTPANSTVVASGARRQHTFFAHRFLRNLFFRETDTVMSRSAAEGLPFIVELWNDVGTKMGPDYKLAATGMTVEVEKGAEQSQIVWITLPTATAATEAYFLALVRKGPLVRYYTFERTQASDAPGATPEAAAWTWDAASAHQNLGLQGPPTISDFKAAVRAHLTAGG